MRGAALTVQMDNEILSWHRHSNFPVMAYSSQANGFFNYPLPASDTPEEPKQKALAKSYLNPKNRARYERAEELAKRLNRTTGEVALSYVWSQSFPSVAIIGSRRKEQLAESLRAADLRLSPEDLEWLENGESIM